MSVDIKPLHQSNEKKLGPEKFPYLPKTVLRGILVGTSGGGKSVMLQNLIVRKDLYGGIFHQKNIIILSPTLEVNDPFVDIPNANKFHKQHEFMRIIDELLDHIDAETKKHGPSKIPPTLVIIDDCSCETDLWRTGGPADRLFTTGRNYNISTIVVAHRLNLLSRNVKLNLNFAIMFPVINQSELESFVIQFAPKKYKNYVEDALVEVFKEPFQFVYINKQLPFDEQLRVGFETPLLKRYNIEEKAKLRDARRYGRENIDEIVDTKKQRKTVSEAVKKKRKTDS